MGLMVTSWLFMFWMQYGGMMGATSAAFGTPHVPGRNSDTRLRRLLLPDNHRGHFQRLGYHRSFARNGMERVDLEFCTHCHSVLQAAMVGYAVQLISASDSSLPMVVTTYVLFPMVLPGALAADGAWVPLAIGTVLRSLVQVWWAWGLFFLEITPMAVVWTILTKKELDGYTPWLVPLYSGAIPGSDNPDIRSADRKTRRMHRGENCNFFKQRR